MHPMEQISTIIGKIYKSGLTTTSGGNISIKDTNGDVWITPSGVDKGSLTPEDIVCVKHDGSIVGRHRPSSEWPFHRAIYNARPDMTAIIHAHPPALVAFSITGLTPNTQLLPLTYKVVGKVGFAPYGTPGSEDLGKKIAEEFQNKRYKAVIMENHGVVLGGSDLMDAYLRLETLELGCRVIVNAQKLGKTFYLTEEQLAWNESKYTHTTHSSSTTTNNTTDEQTSRTEMAQIIRRAHTQGLMGSAFGTVSVRLNGNDFLITPTNSVRWDIVPEHMVKVCNGMVQAGQTPSRLFAMHQRIYARNPHVNSIICSQPTNLMAHAVSHTKFDVRTIPESWIFLQDVPTIPFEMPHNETERFAGMFKTNRLILVENDCVFVTGDKLLHTFDYLEVAEFSAQSLVMASSIGTLQPIGEKEIDELRIAFNVM